MIIERRIKERYPFGIPIRTYVLYKHFICCKNPAGFFSEAFGAII
jgi:hypothetical protein